jgi:mannosyl-3-phosphoglycerate phosphatase
MKARILVFTDLDGTLLDHRTYSFDPAEPALCLLRQKGIPLIFCTSKTRAEIEAVRLVLNNLDPFISENGGAVFIPRGYFRQKICRPNKNSPYGVIELGTPYPRLREVLSQIKEHWPGKLKGFGDFSAEDVARHTGLSKEEAALALKREFDEPFLLEDLSILEKVRELARAAGLHITQGGRFFHLTGDNDKGKASRLLQTMYTEEEGRPVRSIGLGDSLNDLALLEAMDFPVLVQKPGGRYDASVRVPNLMYAPGEGPAGWREAVLELVERLSG